MTVCQEKNNGLQDGDLIPGFCIAFFQNDGKDPLTRHHTVSGLPADCTVGMTLFPYLGNLAQSCADPELCADREPV